MLRAALLFIVVSIYAVLLFLFRSVVLPAKALLMNTLSILASYGALVFIFQDGHFQSLLRFESSGTVEASMPVILFCIVFGLSMDYEVFLLTRIKEEYERTGDNAHSRGEGAGEERAADHERGDHRGGGGCCVRRGGHRDNQGAGTGYRALGVPGRDGGADAAGAGDDAAAGEVELVGTGEVVSDG